MNLKKIYFAIMISIIGFNLKAQTNLVAGDIAFTGYVSSNPTDEFSFVLLKDIQQNTQINFTDNGWTGSAFRTGETTVVWTSNTNYVAGTEIKIVGTTATLVSGASAGSVTGTPLSLSTSGDQIFAYQGLVTAPTFVSGIHMNYWKTADGDPANTTALNWDGQSTSSVSSALPATLNTGVNAVWIYVSNINHPAEKTNARFNCSGPLDTLINLKQSLYNFANWIGDTNTSPTNASFILPANCNYFYLSTDEFSGNDFELKIYPNPAKNKIKIEHSSELKEVKIYSLQGQLVLVSNNDDLDISNLKNGIYIVRVDYINGYVGVNKIIKS